MAEVKSGALGFLLRGWIRQLSPGYGDKAGAARTILRQMQGSLVALVACIILTLVACIDVIYADTFKIMRVPLSVFVGGYSCVIGQVLLLQRRHAALKCLRILTAVCDALEEGRDTTSKEVLKREKDWSRRRTRCLIAYCLVSLVGSLGTMTTDQTMFTHQWTRRHGGAALRYSKAAFDVYATTRGGEDAIRRAAVLGGHLSVAYRTMNDMFGRLLPHYLLVALLMPMVSTAEMLLTNGQADSFAVSTVPFILLEFMPFCFIGQQLEDSSESVAWQAYQGPWLEETCAVRRSRLLIISSAARPAYFGLRGLMRLNRSSFLDALRVWFNYLQVLLNVGGH